MAAVFARLFLFRSYSNDAVTAGLQWNESIDASNIRILFFMQNANHISTNTLSVSQQERGEDLKEKSSKSHEIECAE